MTGGKGCLLATVDRSKTSGYCQGKLTRIGSFEHKLCCLVPTKEGPKPNALQQHSPALHRLRRLADFKG